MDREENRQRETSNKFNHYNILWFKYTDYKSIIKRKRQNERRDDC
jgi:hypothetical protein